MLVDQLPTPSSDVPFDPAEKMSAKMGEVEVLVAQVVEQLKKTTEDRDRLFHALERVGNVAATAASLLHRASPVESRLFLKDAQVVKDAIQASAGQGPKFLPPEYPEAVHTLLKSVQAMNQALGGDVPDWIGIEVAAVDEAMQVVRTLPGLSEADTSAMSIGVGDFEPAPVVCQVMRPGRSS